MSRARHGKKGGGAVPMKVSGNPDVFKEAAGRKKGGKVLGKMDGGKAKHRFDKPGRKSGGRVGANRSPLSTAHSVTSPEKSG